MDAIEEGRSQESSRKSGGESNASKNRLRSMGLYVGSNVPKEMHLDLSKEDICEYGKEIL